MYLPWSVLIIAIFGEDVGFGGVFRCSADLRDKYGECVYTCIYYMYCICMHTIHDMHVVSHYRGCTFTLLICPETVRQSIVRCINYTCMTVMQ